MHWQDIADFVPILLQGAVMSIVITLGCLVLSTVLGLTWALLKMSRYPLVVRGVSTMINVVRGLPMIVLLFYIYFVLPEIHIQVSALQASIIGLGFGYSTYVAEIFRAGIEAVDPGQYEAAQSIGMGRVKTMIRVILPQAIKVALPPYSNTLVMMLKDSSLASTITVAEMTREGQLIASSTFQNLTVYTLVALGYLAMSLPLMSMTRTLERRFGRHRAR
ncbi:MULTISPECIES: amino acid ABC transporter permease [Paraburkholderia]|uniref:Amino acid ABC transporter membrane protein, PAAT family n=1 Tax=Paraburkholderia tuberum TaxID=157910 RepID=A0A1H1KC36_9BURK|nr:MULTISPECIES: amino acid ABC transporter permease [Paraburkholderia]MBB5413512.1 polar amino acid transport system permease protein [Paraburkholderia sp. HC6.4b]MBB5455865.1 polar amino acid transport system permease protein [Paraburkholderia sp. Kb1A]MBB5460741.1 polar amino acid transport system permease protein [Paraburkholderia sp. Cpub6]MBB5496675.1 polar amino acid transport system permease protein [Paraburkholderia sp. MM5384-R2]MBC8725307.1 amino acid ABC transporter permease [Parab